MTKFIKISQLKVKKKIENSFTNLSKYFIKSKKISWWYHNLSRIDFRPNSGANENNFFYVENFKLKFYLNLIIDFFFIVRLLFKRKIGKISQNLCLVYENVKFQKPMKKNFFFGNLFKNINHDELVITYDNIYGKNIIPIYSLTNNKEILISLVKSIISLLKVYFLIQSFFKNNKDFKKYWTKSFFFKEKLKSIFFCYILDSVFKNKKFQNKIFLYPYEEKPYERAINKVSNELNLKTFSYCVNPQDKLASFLKEFKDLNIPRSEKYFFSGNGYNKFFSKLKRKNKLPKQVNLLGSDKSKVFNNPVLLKNRKILLILSNNREFYNFMKFIDLEPKILTYKFLVREYPHFPSNKIKEFIYEKKLENNFSISKNNLLADIKKVKASIFSATSAGIESINFGRLGIWSNLSSLGMNPLFDELSHFYPSITAFDLRRSLDKVMKYDKKQYFKFLSKQQKICKNFYGKQNTSYIKKLIKN